VLEQLKALNQRGILTDLDLHFSRLMVHLAGSDAPELILGACLASHWTGNGHVCVDLTALAKRHVFEDPEDGSLTMLLAPELDHWTAVLRDSAVVGQPGDYRPLVLDEHGRLYLYRYWQYEQQLARDLRVRASDVDDVDEARLRADLEELFSVQRDAPAQRADWQKIAAAVAVLRRFCVISGGPGMGKTTTVIRILALLLGQSAQRPLEIALAAPTGKAAARLQEVIRAAKARLNLAPGLRDAIPEHASTLHRVLGARRDSVHFYHDRDNPLPVDVLVVDEASMVDLALMARLVEALPLRARLILLGDKDQLASVEAGAVLGDICSGAGGYSEPFRTRLEALTGERIEGTEGGDSPFRDSVVFLQRSYRFGTESGIGRLAHAVNEGQAQQALELLTAGGQHHGKQIAWQPLAFSSELGACIGRRIEVGFGPYLACMNTGGTPEEVFSAFNRFRVLCAYRTGPVGVLSVNALIEKILQARRLIDARQTWYAGRPVMVIRNDYNLRLFNGDIGLVLSDPEAEGQLRVFFQSTDGRLRRFSPSRLPEHETVYALTIHKSQGSEFDEVIIVLSTEEASSGITRELIYTGLTRARERVELIGSRAGLMAGISYRLRRSSGLRLALWVDAGNG
jgi:exodeoxyribonuclease V, alpha subunit